METFKQLLTGPKRDTDLDPAEWGLLKEAGFIDSGYGFSYVVAKGVEAAVALGLLSRKPTSEAALPLFGHHMRANPNELDDYADVHRANTRGTAYNGTTGE